ncbi:SDR family oxidoreductase [Phyllobacterium myrsinacearum]|uniref:NADP-dependent 3-hydroxy acid dehydrogenase YdfG n=1 Tax=Phyllobacterium myrsinacearum TaxID=28101 RepID=A0A839EL77_9HYPH|nr:SDR family oxidoreductase [Phyllobacterium myrsinacearum]MBA8881243.1 NADP-dependent 3-hydroxy acid dehydrogenase YdfG [Phyllobacterium myrsinacearum]
MTNPSSVISRKVVLITGASSGIGEATARYLAANGHRVVLGARRADRIAAVAQEIQTAGGDALHRELDVTDLASVMAFAAFAQKHYGRIDVLINNAGVMPLSLVQELKVDEWNTMIDVNLRGVLHGIAAVLPIMREQGRGHIVNVASTSAHRVDPTAAVYCATKFAVRALSEGLRQESKDLRVTVISPGLTRSELFDGISNPQLKAGVHAMLDQSSIPASAIAEAIGYAISQPDNVDVNEMIVRPTAQG